MRLYTYLSTVAYLFYHFTGPTICSCPGGLGVQHVDLGSSVTTLATFLASRSLHFNFIIILFNRFNASMSVARPRFFMFRRRGGMSRNVTWTKLSLLVHSWYASLEGYYIYDIMVASFVSSDRFPLFSNYVIPLYILDQVGALPRLPGSVCDCHLQFYLLPLFRAFHSSLFAAFPPQSFCFR